jgi:hypothetical protein
MNKDIELQTLVMLVMGIIGDKYPFSSFAFKAALPEAYECLQAAKEMLEKPHKRLGK